MKVSFSLLALSALGATSAFTLPSTQIKPATTLAAANMDGPAKMYQGFDENRMQRRNGNYRRDGMYDDGYNPEFKRHFSTGYSLSPNHHGEQQGMDGGHLERYDPRMHAKNGEKFSNFDRRGNNGNGRDMMMQDYRDDPVYGERPPDRHYGGINTSRQAGRRGAPIVESENGRMLERYNPHSHLKNGESKMGPGQSLDEQYRQNTLREGRPMEQGPRRGGSMDRDFDRDPRRMQEEPGRRGGRRMDGPMMNEGPMRNQGPMGRGDMMNEGPMGRDGRMMNQGPMGRDGPMRNEGPMRNQGPMGREGPMRNQGPMRNEGPMGREGPMRNEGPMGREGPMRNEGPTRRGDMRNGPMMADGGGPMRPGRGEPRLERADRSRVSSNRDDEWWNGNPSGSRRPRGSTSQPNTGNGLKSVGPDTWQGSSSVTSRTNNGYRGTRNNNGFRNDDVRNSEFRDERNGRRPRNERDFEMENFSRAPGDSSFNRNERSWTEPYRVGDRTMAASNEKYMGPQNLDGGTRRQWTFDATTNSVQLEMWTDGLPLMATVEIYEGERKKNSFDVYVEDGYSRPYSTVLDLLGTQGATILIRNDGPVEYPLTANVQPFRRENQNPNGENYNQNRMNRNQGW